ncbi:MAG: helix-turn-helix transcriptional regulator [Phycisphaerales bacterium]|nr:helix-turn-helix transcriptional regulator [Phycisphaerales bacterium]
MVVLHAPAQRADRADGPPSDADRTDAGPTRSADGPLGEGDESRHGGQPPAALSMLSRREIEIAGCVAEGLSNKQIAARLHIALSTVKDHMHRILVKTGVPNRAAVAAATRPDGPQRRVN